MYDATEGGPLAAERPVAAEGRALGVLDGPLGELVVAGGDGLHSFCHLL